MERNRNEKKLYAEKYTKEGMKSRKDGNGIVIPLFADDSFTTNGEKDTMFSLFPRHRHDVY